MNINQLFEIFRLIASELLGHTADNPKFAQMPFEAANSVRSTINTKTPVLVLDYPEFSIRGSSLPDMEEILITSFAVVKTVSLNDFKAEEQAMHECWEISKKVLKILIAKRNECPQYLLSPEITAEPIKIMDNANGYLVTIRFIKTF